MSSFFTVDGAREGSLLPRVSLVSLLAAYDDCNVVEVIWDGGTKKGFKRGSLAEERRKVLRLTREPIKLRRLLQVCFPLVSSQSVSAQAILATIVSTVNSLAQALGGHSSSVPRKAKSSCSASAFAAII